MGHRAGSGITVEVSVTVKDGGEAVAVDSSKVAGMFEATGNLGDWEGAEGIPVTVTPTGSGGAAMKFKVEVGEGAEEKGFLRVAP